MARCAAVMGLVLVLWPTRIVLRPEYKPHRLATADPAAGRPLEVALFMPRPARAVGRPLTELAAPAHILLLAPIPEAEHKATQAMHATAPDHASPAPARKAALAPETPMAQLAEVIASALVAEAVIVRPPITFVAAARVRLVHIPGVPPALAAALAAQVAAAAVLFIIAVVAATLMLANTLVLTAVPVPALVRLTSATPLAAGVPLFAVAVVAALATAVDRVRRVIHCLHDYLHLLSLNYRLRNLPLFRQ